MSEQWQINFVTSQFNSYLYDEFVNSPKNFLQLVFLSPVFRYLCACITHPGARVLWRHVCITCITTICYVTLQMWRRTEKSWKTSRCAARTARDPSRPGRSAAAASASCSHSQGACRVMQSLARCVSSRAVTSKVRVESCSY